MLERRLGRVLQLTMDNPAQRNALTPEISRGPTKALRLAADDESVGAIVVRGEGEHFCAGEIRNPSPRCGPPSRGRPWSSASARSTNRHARCAARPSQVIETARAQGRGIECFYRDVRAFRIYEGTSQIHLVNIARHLLR